MINVPDAEQSFNELDVLLKDDETDELVIAAG
jgi:hypothetical protein